MHRAEGMWGAGLRGAQGRFPGQLRPTSFFSWHLISASSQREEATESPAGTWSLGDPPSPRGKCLLLSKDAPLNFRKTWSIGYRRKERGQERRGEGRGKGEKWGSGHRAARYTEKTGAGQPLTQLLTVAWLCTPCVGTEPRTLRGLEPPPEFECPEMPVAFPYNSYRRN